MVYTYMKNTIQFVLDDFKSFPIRWIIETSCWLGILFNTIVIACTVPNIPWNILYPIWIVCCFASSWTSYTRNSSIGVIGSLIFAVLDSIGYYRSMVV